MACPFDGLTFGDVLDEVSPGWRTWGFGPDGPFRIPIFFVGGPPPSAKEIQRDLEEGVRHAEMRRRWAPIEEALMDGTAALVDMDGNVVPRRVFVSGRWAFYCDDRQVERLEVLTEAGEKVVYYNPRFARSAAEDAEKPAVENTPPYSDEGAAAEKKPRKATLAAEMIAWLDDLPATQRRNKTPNALADLYLGVPSRRGSKRYACKVFGAPDKYRKRLNI